MNKQGIEFGLTTILVFVLLIAATIIILVYFEGSVSKMFGWVDDRIASLTGFKEAGIFGKGEKANILARAEAGGDLTPAEFNPLIKEAPKVAAKYLFSRGEKAFTDAKDYEDAKNWYCLFLKGCGDQDFSKYCGAEITVPSSTAFVVSESSNEFSIEEGSLKGDCDLENLKISKQKLEIISKTVRETEEKIEEEVSQRKNLFEGDTSTYEGQVKILAAANNMRKDSENRIQKAQQIRRNIEPLLNLAITNEVKLSTLFVIATTYAEERECKGISEIVEKIRSNTADQQTKLLSIVSYSYPRYEISKIPYRLSLWKNENSILLELMLVEGWCYLEVGNFEKAYSLANFVEEFDPEGSYDYYKEKDLTSSAYKLYRQSVLNLADNIICNEDLKDNVDSCHKLPEELKISKLPGPNINVGNVRLTEEDKKNPKYREKFVCYYSYGGWFGDHCASCKEINSCGNYETGWGMSWNGVCWEDPCKISEIGCLVKRGAFGDSCTSM